ncbi:MAG: glucuronate isomerase [Bacteroidales bacterium]|nr:glucuronate isomerase [Bacteroidales bacterium]MDY5357378.1 glucuronate isomerase [Candidatus Cryptobacteroides sp.]
MDTLPKFINDDFMLTNDYARELYHESAEHMPIIDYHCHLVPKMIADNWQFKDLTEVWLGGDHYKWRAMRGNGVPEEFITGKRESYEKFEKWAQTVPYTMRNPLYHWTHLELARVFDVYKTLSPATAREIYEECTAKLQTPQYRGQELMKRFNVKVVCTTDDPADSLEYHQYINEHPFGVKVLPAWRPDKAMAIEKPQQYIEYIQKLASVAGVEIRNYQDLLDALAKRQEFFHQMGSRLSDHGLETFYAEDFTMEEIDTIFRNTLKGKVPTKEEILKFRSAILLDFARMDHAKGWVQQFHIGAIRDNNTRMFNILGPDTGYDAIHDVQCAAAGHKFFNTLALEDKLTKTILYNLNPKDNEVLATMAYTFNDGTCPGKMQLGSGWWFLDQEDGMRKQINALSALGLLSRFVGMLTDSRSFISYPRHEYFRRILCNVLGEDLAAGKLPKSEMAFIHQMVKDISYNNADRYFGF